MVPNKLNRHVHDIFRSFVRWGGASTALMLGAGLLNPEFAALATYYTGAALGAPLIAAQTFSAAGAIVTSAALAGAAGGLMASVSKSVQIGVRTLVNRPIQRAFDAAFEQALAHTRAADGPITKGMPETTPATMAMPTKRAAVEPEQSGHMTWEGFEHRR
jgi:hypothetical protein